MYKEFGALDLKEHIYKADSANLLAALGKWACLYMYKRFGALIQKEQT